MEMLIVVAIIAILVAIAIPTFTGALNRARYSADVANVRAWYAEELIKYMNDSDDEPEGLTDATTVGDSDLQMDGATVNSTFEDGVFTVTYDSGSTDFDNVEFES